MVSTTSNHYPAPLATLADVTRDHVLMVLEACGGRQTLAATVLKIDRKTIYRMLRRWGVDPRAQVSEP
jgi:transcriptional regulator of acetoin/glycerol metabolism